MEDLKAAYDFLNRPHRKQLEIQRLQETIQALRECLERPSGIDYEKDPVQTSPESRTEMKVVKLIELETKLDRLVSERADLIIEVNEMIDRLPDPEERSVLTLYYVVRDKPEKVAEKIRYSERWMYHIKKQAVRHLFSEMQYRGVV